jgi:hypothetical protein
MALYRCRAARRSGARTGIDPTAQKLKADQIHGSKQGCPTGCPTEGPDGVVRRRTGLTLAKSTAPYHGARRGARWVPNGEPDGVPDKVPDGGPDGGPTGGQIGGLTGCQTGCPTGPDGVPDGVPDEARRSAQWGQTGAMSSATSFWNAMSPV